MKSRRKFIRSSSYLAAGSILLPYGCTNPGDQVEEREAADSVVTDIPLPRKSIGVQVYSVRDALKEDFSGTIARLADIGFEYIEAYGLGTDGKIFDRSAQEYRQIVEDTGMTLLSSHATYFTADEAEPVLQAAQEAGLTYVLVPYLADDLRNDYHKIAETLNEVGAMFKEHGLQLGYHNHDFEFEKQGDITALEILLQETQPDLVTFQADLYWITKGGWDPVELIEQYPGRFSSFHVKDAAEDLEQTTVGTGIIDFQTIFGLKETAGMQHYFVEDERTDDPFANLQGAYAYLNQASFT